MAESENNKIISQNNQPKQSNNLFSLFPFHFKFPFPNGQNKVESTVPESPKPAENESENGTTQRPNIVTFPNYPRQIVTPLESDLEESSGITHNPVIVWQVYALGGFIILKWIWSRWKERNERAKKPPTDDDQSPQSPEEYQSTTRDDE